MNLGQNLSNEAKMGDKYLKKEKKAAHPSSSSHCYYHFSFKHSVVDCIKIRLGTLHITLSAMN